MKTIKKLSKLAVAGVLMTAYALNFNACSEQSPLSSTDESPFAQDNVQLIDLGDAFASLSKGELKVSAVVTPEDGGQLVLIKGKAFKEQQKDFKESGENRNSRRGQPEYSWLWQKGRVYYKPNHFTAQR